VTVRVQVHAVALDTTEGRVEYRFGPGLTVLAGPTGVGKTTLLELVKYGFGCNGKLAPVAVDYVKEVALDVTVGESRLRITRSLDPGKGRTARVTDLITQERLAVHHTDATEPSLSALLMTALGLPSDVRAAARTGSSSNAGSPITFADVYSYMYVPQSEMNHDIAHSQDSYRESKRKAVFELLFGITDAETLRLRSEINSLKGRIEAAEAEYKHVLEFLRSSGTASRIDAEQAMRTAVIEEAEADVLHAELREAVDPITDRETLALRDLLAEAERSLDQARRAVTDLARQQAECASERRRVRGDLDRYLRMRDAGERLAAIEFTVCPRCMQSLTTRYVPEGACRVCLQPDPVATTAEGGDLYEARQLADQLAEMDDQLQAIAVQFITATQVADDREQLVKTLSADLDARTRTRITPRLQALTDAIQRQAVARVRQQELEQFLRQWDRADDIGRVAEHLRAEREGKRSALTQAEERLQASRDQILADLNEEFSQTVAEVGVPSVTTAAIHPTTYLPVLNGRSFFDVSSGGGIITMVQVAYWTSLIAVALRNNPNHYPLLLIIDSPRLALNDDQETLPTALYRRLVAQAGATAGISRRQVQYIIADNGFPTGIRGEYAEEEFGYDRPTVGTIPHSGRGSVRTIELD
jgi:hypothetical protein